MAVEIPSDLVLDVIRAADPKRLQKATAQFDAAPSAAFPSVVKRIETIDESHTSVTSILSNGNLVDSPMSGSPSGSGEVAASAAHRSFEQMVLRNFLESTLPSAESGAFGTDTAAGMWRSMAADQLAAVYAESGGLGIAKVLGRSGEDANMGARLTWAGQWPYFATAQIRSFVG